MRIFKSPHVSIVGWGIVLAGALSLASCSEEEMLDKNEPETPIKFGSVKTRAEVTAATDIEEFKVFAEMNYLLEDNTESTDFMPLLENEKVYRDDNNNFTYTNTRYWVYDRTFNFFAVYPFESEVSRADFVQGENTYDGYTIAFETPATADTDLMTAYKTERTITGNTLPSSVDMEFQHLLSKINIKVAKNTENEKNKVIIKSFSLGGIWKTGTFKTSRFYDYEDNWDFYGSSTLTITKNGQWTLDTNGIGMTGNGFLLMPQSIGLNRIVVTITYEYYTANTDTTPQKTSTVQAFIPVGEWEAATQYNYNLVLAAEDNYIKFTTPTVEPWGSPQSGGTIIIN